MLNLFYGELSKNKYLFARLATIIEQKKTAIFFDVSQMNNNERAISDRSGELYSIYNE